MKNIGKFVNYSTGKNSEFRKITIIYGENGRGKSTLCSIFRSLCTGQSCYINEKKTIKNIIEEPEVTLLVNGTSVAFKRNNWTKQVDNIEIFDQKFIDENIYSGSTIGHDHKKNLYHFVIGQHGVIKAKEVENYDETSRELSSKIREHEPLIKKYIKSDSDLDSFLNLKQDQEIDVKIREQELEVTSLEKIQQIINKPVLKKIFIPELRLDYLASILSKSLDNISKDAEIETKKHVCNCMDSNGEKWIYDGMDYIKNNICPFCGNIISPDVLIKYYKDYFNSSYTAFKSEIKAYDKEIRSLLSNKNVQNMQATLLSNNTLIEYWKAFVLIDYQQIQIETLNQIWNNLETQIQLYLGKKLASPLDAIALDDKLQYAIEDYKKLVGTVTVYNDNVDSINNTINIKKQKLIKGDLHESQKTLNMLYDTKTRHLPEVDLLCMRYIELVGNKRETERNKKKVKQELDEYSNAIFGRYEQTINNYLTIFGASFTIDKTCTQDNGGTPSTNYRLRINDIGIDLNAKDPYNNPCFKNTLSEGEKSSLAFAFFFAKLDLDPISDKIIVLDDPITSLDNNRKTCTQQQISRISKSAKQVIIFSHDPYFLRSIWDNVYTTSADLKTLQIIRKRDDSTIVEWDIIKETESEYFKNYFNLCDYREGNTNGDLRNIARCIRPVLEGNFRVRYPAEFKQNEWLGDFIKKIRESKPDTPLSHLKPAILQEIIDINDYSKKFHHDQNPTDDVIKINDKELLTYVKRTLKLLS